MIVRAVIAMLAAGTVLLAACAPPEQTEAASAPAIPDLESRARDLALSSIIVDTHIDVPYRLEEEWADVSLATESGDFDYPRAVAGGLNAAFMSIYTPAELEAEGRSKAVAEKLIDIVERIVADAPEKFAIAYSPADVERHFEEGLISLPLGMENGSPLEGDLANLAHFYERGIRYVTLAHSLSNHLSDSSYDDNKRWGGLSEFGVEAVREMNRLGIMVDVSHISDDAFWDVLEVTRAPVIASHSSARHFTPGFERNMSDEMIVALAKNGGVIMINFGSSFLTERANAYSRTFGEAWSAHVDSLGREPADDERERFRAAWIEEHGPYPYATLDETLAHFEHVIDLVGIQHVGIGSDYDGVGDSLPLGLKDVSSYPNLVRGLLERGYSEADIRKILGENLLRVWREVEKVAHRLQDAA
ncbi:MAG TPA: dipeptidase [Woeseiaceae bacterium]|nr:dipeptidase [Woeseiaceae bacterium]